MIKTKKQLLDDYRSLQNDYYKIREEYIEINGYLADIAGMLPECKYNSDPVELSKNIYYWLYDTKINIIVKFFISIFTKS